MDFGGVGLRVASGAFVPLVKRLFRQDGAGAGLVEQPVKLSKLVSFGAEKRELVERDVHKLSEELVHRALREMGPHDAPSPDHQREAAGLLARSLMCLGELDMDDVQAVRLGHEELARRLQRRGDRYVSAAARHLHDRLLELACLHVLNFFTQRSTFVARTLVEQSRQLNDLTARMDLLLERVPLRSAEDAAFESRYAAYVQQEHGRLTIYGLDLRQEREWPLDDAYLSLEVRGRDPERADEPAPQRAERALSGQERVLLRGLAGSGKTTLVQRLAVTAARADVREGMTHLIGRVPLVLALRTLTRDGARLPTPDRFLTAMDCPLAAGQPDGWMDRILTAGRALLLVDGIDEIPENERDAARRWLRGLKNAYPGSLWLVTARPSAVPDDWLAREGFAEYSLAPMNGADVRAFVHRWHRAAGVKDEVERALLDLVHRRNDLSTLATNPLMCAMICALHRERNGHLPHGRKALYDAALSMLLERRDRERPDPPRGRVELDAETQISLLQKLAFWLITNGRSEMTADVATSVLDRALPLIHRGAELGSAHEVLRHLLERSGVLREPGPGAVDFVHRTFQDYLGAREIVEWQHFPMLVERAHEDQWEDVVRMAVAHAQPIQRGDLLTQLVERGDREERYRIRLHLLAMACLEHATQLATTVRQTILKRAAQFIPPMTNAEAWSLAQLGSIAVELLPGPETLTDDEAEAVVYAASRIASDAALTRLRAFRDHPFPKVQDRLATAWNRFDIRRYFDDVVAHLPRTARLPLPATSPEELACLATLDDLPAVDMRGDFTEEDILAALRGRGVSVLRLRDNGRLDNLAFLGDLGDISSLLLDSCPGIVDLTPLRELQLENLSLYSDTEPWRMIGLDELTGLRVLRIGSFVTVRFLSELPYRSPLEHLRLPMDTPDLDRIGFWPELNHLDVHESGRGLAGGEWERVADLPNLRRITLNTEVLHSLAWEGSRLPHIEHAMLFQREGTTFTRGDMEHLAEGLPGLRTLMLNDDARDFAPLASLPDLRSVHVREPSELTNAPPHLDLTCSLAPRY
ncbi:NACHT domain-containing protein [Streptomyces sp. B6B3]|uniref:NACHT domain-containing protein n=1 Tax=Streptomyces sp. B6B3 TaxID=3153570 RepID=UPI00325D7C26